MGQTIMVQLIFGLQNMSALNWLKLEDTTIPEFDINRMNTYFISMMTYQLENMKISTLMHTLYLKPVCFCSHAS